MIATARKAWKRTIFAYDILVILFSYVRMALNPNDIRAIFITRSFREHESFQVTLRSFHSNPELSKLIRERYKPQPLTLETLQRYPPGSLGFGFAAFLKQHDLKIVFYPEMENMADDEINYMIQRARETHDLHHFVLGIPPVDAGEVKISAFYLAQHPIAMSAMILGTAFFSAAFRYPHRIQELVQNIADGWQLGKSTADVLAIRWEELLHEPLEDVREMIRLKAPSPEKPATTPADACL